MFNFRAACLTFFFCSSFENLRRFSIKWLCQQERYLASIWFVLFFLCTEALLKRKIFECMNGKNNYLDALAARTARRTRFQKL